MKVNKIEQTKQYGAIFDVGLPVRFYFNKDGSFDGIEVSVETATKRDQKLISELCLMLAKATGINYTYTIKSNDNGAKKE